MKRLYADAANVALLTKWHDTKDAGPDSPEPRIISDYWHASAWRKGFLPEYGDNPYNVCVSLTGDGITKGSLTSKSVFPVSVRIESLPPQVRNAPETQHMMLLSKADFTDIDVSLVHVAAELKRLAETGVEIEIAGVGRKTVKVHVGTIEGDLRALPSLVGKYRDPAVEHACPNCMTVGRRYGTHRTVYDDQKEAPAYDAVKLPEFKRIPVLACVDMGRRFPDKYF